LGGGERPHAAFGRRAEDVEDARELGGGAGWGCDGVWLEDGIARAAGDGLGVGTPGGENSGVGRVGEVQQAGEEGQDQGVDHWQLCRAGRGAQDVRVPLGPEGAQRLGQER